MFVVAPIVYRSFVLGPCFVLWFFSSFLRQQELVSLLKLCSCCHVAAFVLCLILSVLWVRLWFVSVVVILNYIGYIVNSY